MRKAIYFVEPETEDPKGLERLLRRLASLHRDGSISIKGVIVEADNRPLNGLSNNVVPLKIRRIKMQTILVIE